MRDFSGAGSGLNQARARQLIIGSAAIGSLGVFGVHVLLPALPSIARGFSVSPATAQLLVSLALIATAFGNLVIAPMSDRFGRRPVILAGLGLYLAGSLGALAAPTIQLLIVARVLQAFGGGAAMAVARTTVTDYFGPGYAASALAWMATAILVVPMVAPTLGGFATEWAGWRAPFALAALLGLGVLTFTFLRIGETHRGAPAAGPSIGMLKSYRLLLATPGYRAYIVYGACMMGAVQVFITGAPYVAIDVFGISPGSYGLWFILPAAASFTGFYFTARSARRLGGMRMMRMGATLSSAGAIGLLGLMLAHAWEPLALILPGMLICFANALSGPNSTSGAIGARPEIAGAASGLLGFTQLITSAIAVQVVAALQNHTPLPFAVGVLAMNLAAHAALLAIRRIEGDAIEREPDAGPLE
jgi:DHA1 family bicyclomycin/chloramphenicol resistance-like MFS transporter